MEIYMITMFARAGALALLLLGGIPAPLAPSELSLVRLGEPIWHDNQWGGSCPDGTYPCRRGNGPYSCDCPTI